MESYIDLAVLINGGMDAFLLIVTGRFLNCTIKPSRILCGVLLGEIPVFLVFYAPGVYLNISKIIIPFCMIRAAFPWKNLRNYGKILLGFWLLSAGLGGFTYALWQWSSFGGTFGSEMVHISLENIWVLPIVAGLWWIVQKVWRGWQDRANILEQTIFELEIDFGEEGKALKVKALLDTGNQLKDPLTGKPVIILEERLVKEVLPEDVKAISELPWSQEKDPWPLLWKTNPLWTKYVVFIPFLAVDHQSWLLGIRPRRVRCFDRTQVRDIAATVALVEQALSPEGEYQALLHPEHLQKGVV